jgi:hypothetical protein
MIPFPANTQIRIVVDVTDMRRGFTGLSAMVQNTLQQNPLAGKLRPDALSMLAAHEQLLNQQRTVSDVRHALLRTLCCDRRHGRSSGSHLNR